jgi:3',5'-cyclic AMP phosphodiesterase CpdA
MLTQELETSMVETDEARIDTPLVRPRRRGRGKRVAMAIVLVIAVFAIGLFLSYRRQIVSYLTHRKGGPSETVPYVPFDPQPTTHLAAAGDTGDSGKRLAATGALIADLAQRTTTHDALLLLGDNVYPDGDPERLPATVFEPFATTLARGTELLAILGNHDVKRNNGDAQMQALGMPGRWWARRVGDVSIVGLDSTQIENEAQLQFLDAALTATDATWRIVLLHHPPYSDGYQGSNLKARNAITPIVERHHVQLVLSGHDHDYQRSVPINGVTYVVSGAGSGTRRTGEASFTEESFSSRHFLDMSVFADRMVVRAVIHDGSVADEFVLTP